MARRIGASYATANKFFFRDMSGESFDNLVQEKESLEGVVASLRAKLKKVIGENGAFEAPMPCLH